MWARRWLRAPTGARWQRRRNGRWERRYAACKAQVRRFVLRPLWKAKHRPFRMPPMQPLCLMYEDAQGRQSTAPAYIGDMSLGQSLDALLRGGPLTAHVYVGEALAPGADRRTLAAQAEQTVAAALRSLQGAGAPARAAAVLESEASAIPNATDATASHEGTLIDNVDQHGRSA